MLGKLTTTLITTALFIVASAGLASVAIADHAPDHSSASAASDNAARGEQLFALCTQCHAADGGGDHVAQAPSIAGLPSWYIEAQLKKFKNGIRGLHPDDPGGLRMYPMSLWLKTESDQKAVASYISNLARVAPPKELAHAGNAAKGQGYFAVCSACHGADGNGNRCMGAPPLVGQSDWYLYSSIQKFKNKIRGNGTGDTNGQVMIGMAATLPNDDAIRDVIAYIQKLEKK